MKRTHWTPDELDELAKAIVFHRSEMKRESAGSQPMERNNVIAWPRQKKRGPKVKSGTCANAVAFPFTAEELYARLASAKYNPPDRENAYKEQLAMARQIWGGTGRLTLPTVRGMIQNRIQRLRSEIKELEALQQER